MLSKQMLVKRLAKLGNEILGGELSNNKYSGMKESQAYQLLLYCVLLNHAPDEEVDQKTLTEK